MNEFDTEARKHFLSNPGQVRVKFGVATPCVKINALAARVVGNFLPIV